MIRFDTIAVIDWSGGNDRGPRPVADAIWSAISRPGGEDEPVYHRNRQVAVAWIEALIAEELEAGRRLFLGFDFPFGYPDGLATRLVGAPDVLGLWDWFGAHLQDAPLGNNRFDLAGEINAMFPGIGPFWFNGLKREIADLPRKGRVRVGHGLCDRRRADVAAKGAFSPWQMGGAGAVGGQVMTGLAALSALRRRFPGMLRAWPFEPLDGPVALVEVWPSLIARAIASARAPGEIKDRAQVRVLARAIRRLQEAGLIGRALEAPAEACREEGWIFGLDCAEDLSRHAG